MCIFHNQCLEEGGVFAAEIFVKDGACLSFYQRADLIMLKALEYCLVF
jgi:hypothetical protein